jgi:hypothetical protein
VSSALQQRDLGHRGPVARSQEPASHMTSPPPKSSYRKVREPRRHTLQNGVDFNMVSSDFHASHAFANIVIK